MGPATANGTIGNARLSADLGSLRLGVRKLRSLYFMSGFYSTVFKAANLKAAGIVDRRRCVLSHMRTRRCAAYETRDAA